MGEKTDEALELLRAEVASLREQVASLSTDLRTARSHIDLTMRGQVRCRACNCRRIAHAPSMLDRSQQGNYALSIYRITGFFTDEDHGQLEAYICTRCGLVEWWVTNPAALQPYKDHLYILDGDVSGPKDPYR